MVCKPEPWRPQRVGRPLCVAVVGGGVAGCAAATVLAERGVRVTLREKAGELGGRAAEGHGFHAFFRHYHNLRALLGRVGARLVPLADYPIVSPEFPPESFTGLPARPPWSLLALVLRSPSIGWRDLRRMDGVAATPLISYDRDVTYAELDGVTASELLDSLRVPKRARSMLFEVFSHSFFNREEEMSAAELVQMFHFYFLGNPEGLLFDVPDGDYRAAIWQPWQAYLEKLGVDIATGRPAGHLEPEPDGWQVDGDHFDFVVVATDVPGLQALAGGTPLEPMVSALPVAPPYAVLRARGDRDCKPERAPFAGVSGAAVLDSITLTHRLPGGPVEPTYELHAYAADGDVRPEQLLADLATLYPETAGMGVLDQEWRVGVDCSGFPPGSDAGRATVECGLPRIFLAGDYVKLDFPTALMERAAASGLLAANAVLGREGLRSEPVWSIPRRGLLARLRPGASPR